jgi:MFS superfamily sulfate permease-like transporter
VFLLAAVLALPGVLHQIPLAVLGAMLVFTGFRLANPAEFVKTLKVGVEQFVVFVGTILATLATDLLVGIGVGIGLEVLSHLLHGAPVRSLFLFRSEFQAAESPGGKRMVLAVSSAALFTNWLGLRKAILAEMSKHDEVEVDLSRTKLVDHSVMQKLHALEREFATAGKHLSVTGLDNHRPLSAHQFAARKQAG